MGLEGKSAVIGIILVNTVISILYMLIAGIKERKLYVFFRGLTMLFCPVIGFVCYFFSFVFEKLLKDEIVDYSNLSVDKSKQEFLENVDKEQELEVLPIEEILTVSVAKDRRKAIMNMTKMNMHENLGLLRKAVENEDSETSHYAASVLTDIISKFQLQLSDLQVKYDSDRSNKENNIEFLDAVMRILNSGGLIGVEKMKYDYMFINLLINLEKYHAEAVKEEYYAVMVKALHSVGRMQEAENWADKSLERHPETEQSYLNVMYIKYILGKEEDFEEALGKLRKSSVDLSQKGLDIVRFWIAK